MRDTKIRGLLQEVAKLNEEHGYICFYNQRKVEVKAASTYEAQKKAAAMLSVPEKKRYMISVKLAEKDGEPVIHKTSDL